MEDGRCPLINVPSGRTFARRVLTLKEIFPAGAVASPNVLAKNTVRPVRLTVSAVIVIEPGGVAGVPPSMPELSWALLRMTTLAASVVSGRRPEMVNLPAGPAVLPTSLAVLIKTRRAPLIGVSSAFAFTRNVLTLRVMSPAGAGPIVVATMVAPPAPVSSGRTLLVRRSESAVIVMGEAIVLAVPPKIRLLMEIS